MDRERWTFEEGEELAPGRLALKRLGGGSRFDVWLALDERLMSIVVAKILRPGREDDDRSLRELRAEAEMLDRLAHPMIVRSFGADLDGPRPHLVLEHIEGPTLRTLVRRYGKLSMEQLIPLALHGCAALHYLASEGVVHLDIKPDNIVMSAPPRVIDLSVACDVRRAARLRQIVGTYAYMSPEQCKPEELGPIGTPADVWGLGMSLYKAAMGYRPFPGRTDVEAHNLPQLVEAPLPMPPNEIPAAFATTILACLEREPANRPTALEVALALEPLVAAMPRYPVLRRRRISV